MNNFPGASYDHWKTTPPDDWYGHGEEMTPEQEAEEWFDEWYGDWLSYMWSVDYELAFDEEQVRA